MAKVNFQTVKPVVQHLNDLRNEMAYSALFGEYKNYKSAQKEYASLGVKNLNIIKTLPPVPKINVPLFSKLGWNVIKVWFLNTFRIKTPDEKLFKKMIRKESIIKQYIKK